jgi:uncharacterized protein
MSTTSDSLSHTPNAASTSAVFSGIRIIDVDTHYSEPSDLWLKRAPRSLKSRVPQIKAIEGGLSWVIDGDKPIGQLGPYSNSAIDRAGVKPRGLDQMKFTQETCHPGSYDLSARLKVMDDFGIWAQVVYPNILGFGGQRSAKVDPALRLLCTQIYNDAMAELQADSKGRLFPMALLPWWDVGAAVKEIERTHAMGLRGVNINSDPQNHLGPDGKHLRDFGSTVWNPLWEICSSLALPINFHIGASEQSDNWLVQQGWPSLDSEMKGGLGGAMLFLDNGRVMMNVILSGLLDRYPKLRFVSVESGIGWIPFILEAVDYQFAELNTRTRLERKPSEYFATNFSACFWFECRNVVELIRMVGVDNVMFETDFPHPTCLHPRPIDRLAVPLARLDAESRRKVVSGNAAGLYNIPID